MCTFLFADPDAFGIIVTITLFIGFGMGYWVRSIEDNWFL